MRTSRERTRRTSRTLTLALIGGGRWGGNIRRTLADLPGCRLAAVETRGWRKLLRRSDLDGVLIATTASTHADIARPFIERGIATFVEKPFTTSLRDALTLERAAARSHALVFVGHIHLFSPAYDAAKRLAQRAGPIRFIVGEGMNNGPYRDDVSALWDWGTHDIAMSLDLLRKMPDAVQAWGVRSLRPATTLDDFVQLHLRFPSNVHGFYTVSWLTPEKRKRLTIVGARDTVVYDDVAPAKVTLFRGMGPRVGKKQVERREPEISHPRYSAEPPLRRELRAFLTCIRRGKVPRSDLAQGVNVVRILEAAHISLEKGGRIIPLVPG